MEAMTQNKKGTTIRSWIRFYGYMFASETKQPKYITDMAFQVFKGVYDNTEKPEPYTLSYKTREDFKPEETLVAIDQQTGEVAGAMLVEPIESYSSKKILFQSNAEELIAQDFSGNIEKAKVLGSLTVSKDHQGQGIGIQLLQQAKRITDFNCITIVPKESKHSRKSLIKAGFFELKRETFQCQYTFDGKDVFVKEDGERQFNWNIFVPIRPV